MGQEENDMVGRRCHRLRRCREGVNHGTGLEFELLSPFRWRECLPDRRGVQILLNISGFFVADFVNVARGCDC